MLKSYSKLFNEIMISNAFVIFVFIDNIKKLNESRNQEISMLNTKKGANFHGFGSKRGMLEM